MSLIVVDLTGEDDDTVAVSIVDYDVLRKERELAELHRRPTMPCLQIVPLTERDVDGRCDSHR